MPKGELFIRKASEAGTQNGGWVDAYDSYGVSFSDPSLSALVTPAPNKEPIQNKSRLQHGKRVVRNKDYVKKDEREVTLEMHISAANKAEFWTKYNAFCDEILDYGHIDIKHKDITYVDKEDGNAVKHKVFRMNYLSCTQFSEFMQQLAKFSLRLSEPDPANRKEEDAWAAEEEEELNPQTNT